MIAYREGEAGRRGAGRWLWKLPAVDLVAGDDQDGQPAVQGGHAAQEKAGGYLKPEDDAETREYGLLKPNVQDGHLDGLDGQDCLGGQGGQDGQRLETGHLERCGHGYPSAKGCYLCDSDHPYRKKEGTT